jgi:UDP-3-O-acyl N-acetylglucosamine deacetylase
MSSAAPARQTTLARAVEACGVALHSGASIHVRLLPAPADAGIRFRRADLPHQPIIPVSPDAIRRDAANRRTELTEPAGTAVATTEHLLAACLGLGLDNALIELDGPELPIFDGSALPYVDLIDRAGLTELDAPRRLWRLRRPVSLVRERAQLHAVPAAQLCLAFVADLAAAGLPCQVASLALHPDTFRAAIAPARTFCFYEDVEQLRAAGLIRGGSLDCAIVLRDGRPIGTDYRLPNELSCHKLLDLMGDLAILGRPIGALISAHATGHALHHEFIDLLRKELFE